MHTAQSFGHSCSAPILHATRCRLVPPASSRRKLGARAGDLQKASCTCICLPQLTWPHILPILGLATGLASTAQGHCADLVTQPYVPGPVEVGPEIWAGVIASCIPFAIGSWEFAKRIIIQRRCATCQGSGLVMRGRFARKCPECGGFFPWQGWKRFFTSTAAPGNGGPLRAPRGQTSVFYRVPPASGAGQNGVGGEGTAEAREAAAEAAEGATPEEAVSSADKGR